MRINFYISVEWLAIHLNYNTDVFYDSEKCQLSEKL